MTTAQDTAQARVQAYCGWHIAPTEDATVTLDGPGSGVLVLPSLHVTTVASVTELGTLVEPGTYSWSETGVLRRTTYGWRVDCQARWTGELRGLVVAFTHGYSEWPLEVAAVVDGLAARIGEVASVYSQVGQVVYATGSDGAPLGSALTEADRAVLDRYRLPPLP